MPFVLTSILSAVFFALTFYFRKQAGKFISTPAALAVEVIVEVLLISFFFMYAAPEFKKGLDFLSKGVLFASLAGIMIAIGVILNFESLKSGFLSKVIIITSPSQIIFGVILGYLLIQEAITLKQIIGAVFAIIAIILMV